MGLENLPIPSFWSKLKDAEPSTIFTTRSSILFTLKNLPKVLHLIEQDYVGAFKNPSEKLLQPFAGKSLLTVLLIEDEGQFSSPLRLVYVLKAISSLI